MMIPHHQGAVGMARLVLVHGRDPLTRHLAEEIIASNGCIIIDLAVVGRSQQTSSTPSSRTSKRNMVAVDLKGVAKVTAKGRTYYYAWRGGPRLRSSPGSPEFITSYQEAHANARAPDVARFHSLILL